MNKFHIRLKKNEKYEIRVSKFNPQTEVLDIYLFEASFTGVYKDILEFRAHRTTFSVDLEFDEVTVTMYDLEGCEESFEFYHLITIKDLATSGGLLS